MLLLFSLKLKNNVNYFICITVLQGKSLQNEKSPVPLV